nr:hypothetical protein Iba_chr11fCG9580 [Ipomoea batatas]
MSPITPRVPTKGEAPVAAALFAHRTEKGKPSTPTAAASVVERLRTREDRGRRRKPSPPLPSSLPSMELEPTATAALCYRTSPDGEGNPMLCSAAAVDHARNQSRSSCRTSLSMVLPSLPRVVTAEQRKLLRRLCWLLVARRGRSGRATPHASVTSSNWCHLIQVALRGVYSLIKTGASPHLAGVT